MARLWRELTGFLEPYQYKPLPGPRRMRVLVLHPGKYEADIQCSLEDVSIDSHPTYEALSYCWATEDGDDSRSQMINCDGRSVMITKNCELAIRRFRFKPLGILLSTYSRIFAKSRKTATVARERCGSMLLVLIKATSKNEVRKST
jgi:hypothetical protein